MQKVRSRTFPEGHSASTACRHAVSGSFTPLAGVLFAFPSWYWFTIGRQVVFSLGRWSSQIPTGLLEPRGTQEPLGRPDPFAYRAVTCCGLTFQTVQLGSSFVTS